MQFMQFKMRNRNRGVTVVELAGTAIFFIVLTLLMADIAILVVANQTNNEACRDAARAAGLAPPDKARTAADGALTAHQRVDGTFVKALRITQFRYNGLPPRWGTADSIDPANQPTVFVTTEITVRIPAPIIFFSAEFKGQNGDLAFTSSYLYPILNLETSNPPGDFDPNHSFSVLPVSSPVPGQCNNPPSECPPAPGGPPAPAAPPAAAPPAPTAPPAPAPAPSAPAPAPAPAPAASGGNGDG